MKRLNDLKGIVKVTGITAYVIVTLLALSSVASPTYTVDTTNLQTVSGASR